MATKIKQQRTDNLTLAEKQAQKDAHEIVWNVLAVICQYPIITTQQVITRVYRDQVFDRRHRGDTVDRPVLEESVRRTIAEMEKQKWIVKLMSTDGMLFLGWKPTLEGEQVHIKSLFV